MYGNFDKTFFFGRYSSSRAQTFNQIERNLGVVIQGDYYYLKLWSYLNMFTSFTRLYWIQELTYLFLIFPTIY